MKWIDSKQEMPREKEDVLLSDGENIGFGYWMWEYGQDLSKECYYPWKYLKGNLDKKNGENEYPEWTDETHCLRCSNSGQPKVTHWMRLPNLPGKDKPFCKRCRKEMMLCRCR